MIVLSVVRNGELHVRAFIEHHLDLGATHIVLLLNGSTDATESIAKRYERVTLLRCGCPYKRNEEHMKRYLVRRFARARWSLFVDIDELFDYPGSTGIPLPALVHYLNGHGYTAVVAQMLDMFGDEPLNTVNSSPDDDPRTRYTLYDISAIEKRPYRFGVLGTPDIRLHVGGIRKQIFGTDNGLTKATLVKAVAGVEVFSDWHHAYGSHAADFTAVLLHYPFVESFAAKAIEAAATQRYKSSSDREYQRYASVMAAEQPVVLRSASAVKLGSIDELLDRGFLVAGGDFRRLVSASKTEVRAPSQAPPTYTPESQRRRPD